MIASARPMKRARARWDASGPPMRRFLPSLLALLRGTGVDEAAAIAATGYDGWVTVELYPYIDNPDQAGREGREQEDEHQRQPHQDARLHRISRLRVQLLLQEHGRAHDDGRDVEGVLGREGGQPDHVGAGGDEERLVALPRAAPEFIDGPRGVIEQDDIYWVYLSNWECWVNHMCQNGDVVCFC